MTSSEIRKKYLDFFKSKGHTVIPSASLIPENDPSVLFTTAGMHPLVPFLLGEKHPAGRRLVDVQKCVRTGDIDEVGNYSHHTFFEMLGNWSLGDPSEPDGIGQAGYFKKEAIEWSWEFLTSEEWLGLDKDRLAVSVFEGDKDSPFDQESYDTWIKLGIPEKRIARLPKKNNWWGMETGPCGPDTEMFYWTGPSASSGQVQVPESFNDDNSLWLEIWNDVFLQYEKKKRALLIDGMFCLYDKDFNLNEDFLYELNRFNIKKILVVNGFSEKAKEMLRDTGIEVFSLELEGIKKEDKRFFEELKDKYNINAEEFIYIDHDEKNINGAKDAGIEKVKIYKNDIQEIIKFINENTYLYSPLKQKNVDTGMGLERTLAVINDLDDNYKTDLFWPIIEKIESLSGKKYEDSKKEFRIIADHFKAAVFMIGDGVKPSNTDRGYVLRRLIRRAVRYANIIGITHSSLGSELTDSVIEIYKDEYKNLTEQKEIIKREIADEEEKFRKTLQQGLKEFEKLGINNAIKIISGKDAFNLFQSFGFPIEMTKELANEDGLEVDEEGFREEFKKHQELSRTASAGMFKGGLADASYETTKLHTAAHLMLAGLRRVLGEGISQKGSNITAERLRFDFNYGEKVIQEQLKQVEDFVNKAIKQKLPVEFKEVSLDEARAMNATGVFDSKYGDKVKVYTIGDNDNPLSREICGGPHATNTGELGKFKITKEESASAGTRRIKAVLE